MFKDYKDIRRKVENKVGGGLGCHIEQLSLPKIASSSAYIKHSIDFATINQLMSHFSFSLRSLPISIKNFDTHQYVSSGSVLHSYTPMACYADILQLSNNNRTQTDNNIFNIVNVVITSSHVLYHDDETETMLREVEIVGKRNRQTVNEKNIITCAFKNPDLLVSQEQCKTLLDALATEYNITNNVKVLSEIKYFPAFVVRNGNELKLFEFGQTLECTDSAFRLEMEELFFTFSHLMLELSQMCDFFSFECKFLECGMNLHVMSLKELNVFAQCLDDSIETKKTKRSNLFSSLLEGLGLIRSASEISLAHLNEISSQNFNRLKDGQLGLEKAIIEQSLSLHDILKKENKQISQSYDRVSMLSGHFNLVQHFNYRRESALATFRTFSNTFRKMSESIKNLLQLALAPLTQRKDGIYCHTSECIDTNSLLIKQNGDQLSVSARLLKIESTAAGRVSCPLFNVSGEVKVHGMLDSIVYLHPGGEYYWQKSNKMVSNACLYTGMNCPDDMRDVTASDLINENIYFFINNEELYVQCIVGQELIGTGRNYSCSLSPISIEPPIIALRSNGNHQVIESHNIHLYISIPRQVAHFDQDIFEKIKEADIPTYTGSDLERELGENTFNPFSNLIHGVILFTPLSAFLLCTCVCLIFCKYPKLPRNIWRCCRGSARRGVRACNRMRGVYDEGVEVTGPTQSRGEQKPGASAPAFEDSVAMPPPARAGGAGYGQEPIREREPFCHQPGPGVAGGGAQQGQSQGHYFNHSNYSSEHVNMSAPPSMYVSENVNPIHVNHSHVNPIPAGIPNKYKDLAQQVKDSGASVANLSKKLTK